MVIETFKDDYEHISGDVEYILENILQDNDGSEEFNALDELFSSSILNSCECNNCSENCVHGENYKVEDGKFILNEDRRCKDLIYECSDDCKCQACCNKLVQFGPRDDLVIQATDSKGFGLVSTSFINEGSFICEYAGELLTKSEAIRRDKENQAMNKMNYIFCLNEINSADGSSIQTFVDPSRKGNIGRYINHSCDANCDIISVRVDSIIPKIAIFANRNIPSMTEITFSYGLVDFNVSNESKKKCHCNSAHCKLYLPNLAF